MDGEPERAFFLPDGQGFVATELTRGPWSPDHQHGGPAAALLARAIERRAEELGPCQVLRLTVEFLRPLPIDRLMVYTDLLHGGRKVRLVCASLRSDGRECARATGLAVRTADVPVPDKALRALQARARPAPPDEVPPFAFTFFRWPVGYHVAMEGRLARGVVGEGPVAMWMRPRVALLPGEGWSPLQRVMVAADSGNGVSLVLDPRRVTFLNADLTVYLHRLPVRDWVCLDAATIPQRHGLGVAETALFDEQGPIGRSLQGLVLEQVGA